MSALKVCGRRIIELEKRIAELEESFDASMGLIEAAEWHDARASAFIEAEGDPGARYRLVQWHMNCAKELRDLATERIGKL